MDCPYCGNEMEKGVILSSQEINWSKKKHLLNNSDFHKDSICLSKPDFFKGSAVIAYCCKRCEQIIINYKDGQCDMN